MVEMKYTGPGINTKTIHVRTDEVKALEDTGLWSQSTDADVPEDDGKEEE